MPKELTFENTVLEQKNMTMYLDSYNKQIYKLIER